MDYYEVSEAKLKAMPKEELREKLAAGRFNERKAAIARKLLGIKSS